MRGTLLINNPSPCLIPHLACAQERLREFGYKCKKTWCLLMLLLVSQIYMIFFLAFQLSCMRYIQKWLHSQNYSMAGVDKLFWKSQRVDILDFLVCVASTQTCHYSMETATNHGYQYNLIYYTRRCTGFDPQVVVCKAL